MTLNELILKYPQFRFLKDSAKFQALPKERQEFVLGLLEDAMFWIELDDQPHADDGFKFLAASFGLNKAQEEAGKKGLTGKEREEFIRPYQELYTLYNPYSGNDKKD